jgi:hypothetical protein
VQTHDQNRRFWRRSDSDSRKGDTCTAVMMTGLVQAGLCSSADMTVGCRDSTAVLMRSMECAADSLPCSFQAGLYSRCNRTGQIPSSCFVLTAAGYWKGVSHLSRGLSQILASDSEPVHCARIDGGLVSCTATTTTATTTTTVITNLNN